MYPFSGLDVVLKIRIQSDIFRVVTFTFEVPSYEVSCIETLNSIN